jgi:hypothetical protein
MQASKAKNPSFTYSPMNRLNSYSESASYFELLKNATTQSVPMKFVKIFFGEYCCGVSFVPAVSNL